MIMGKLSDLEVEILHKDVQGNLLAYAVWEGRDGIQMGPVRRRRERSALERGQGGCVPVRVRLFSVPGEVGRSGREPDLAGP